MSVYYYALFERGRKKFAVYLGSGIDEVGIEWFKDIARTVEEMDEALENDDILATLATAYFLKKLKFDLDVTTRGCLTKTLAVWGLVWIMVWVGEAKFLGIVSEYEMGDDIEVIN